MPIRIAAGCAETCWEAVQETQLGPDKLRESAQTYLQVVLFSDSGDCFRVLGVRPGASKSQMREHMRWLLQWLHPDRNASDWESVYAERVIGAWREAKTRTAAVQSQQRLIVSDTPKEKAEPSPRRKPIRASGRLRAPMRWVPIPIDPPRRRLGTPLRIGAAVLVLGLAVLLVPRFEPVASWIEASGTAAFIGQ